METSNCCSWSELPMDILKYLLEGLSFVDFHRAKMVCSNWYLCSKQTFGPKGGFPMLILFPEDGCALYNHPNEDRVYKNKNDFSEFRFLGSSGKWFLVVDPRSNLYIIDVFSEKRIDLPPLESIKGSFFKVERVGDKEFKEILVCSYKPSVIHRTNEDLRGVLWVDDKKEDYVVVWLFQDSQYIGFCKKGDDHYREISTRIGVHWALQGVCDMVLKGYSLYVLTISCHIRLFDLSGQNGFKNVSERHWVPMCKPDLSRDETERLRANKVISYSNNIAVTTSGEVLMVHTNAYESTFGRHRMFRLYKMDPKYLYQKTYEVDSLGDEALFLDLGITVPADHTLGIEPNSIYFSRDHRCRHERLSCLDICVYNLATKIIKRFPGLSSNLKLKDARWFLPS